MAEIKTLKDYADNIIYPQSITKAIVDANGVDLDALHQTFISSAAIEDVENLDIEHESTSNKVLSINNNSTDVQYPSAKAVYDLMLANKDVGINMEVVDSLPTENIDSKTIYLVQSDAEGTYGMFVYVNNEWREVGNTEVDLSNYATKDEIPTKVSQLTNDKSYATTSQIPDVSNFATKTEVSSSSIPSGLICMWSGATVPTGWALCNGSNGTPDLRDRFIVGSGSSYAIGTTGGSNTVTLTIAQMPAHTHTATTKVTGGSATGSVTIPSYGSTAYSGSGFALGAGTSGQFVKNQSYSVNTTFNPTATTTVSNTGSGSSHEDRPPYYALAFIMKL